MKVPHKLITNTLLLNWGHIKSGKYFVNWNGIYLIENNGKWDYGHPNHYRIDKEHPFKKEGEVTYMDELDYLQFKRSGRGLEYTGNK